MAFFSLKLINFGVKRLEKIGNKEGKSGKRKQTKKNEASSCPKRTLIRNQAELKVEKRAKIRKKEKMKKNLAERTCLLLLLAGC